MACKCSPSLDRLMADFAARYHVNSGCCAGAAHHQANPNSDHEPDASGYAHAQDIHELRDHDMQPYVDFIMAHPDLFTQVKYLIYEGHIYYPHDGARPAGRYVYTGPNAHAGHLHVSIFSNATFYAGSWHVAAAYDPSPPAPEEDDMPATPFVVGNTDDKQNYLVFEDDIVWLDGGPPEVESARAAFPDWNCGKDVFAHLKASVNARRKVAGLAPIP